MLDWCVCDGNYMRQNDDGVWVCTDCGGQIDTSRWEDEPDDECPYCHGTGGDPWNDGITPCPECDGEGYLWWQ